MFLLLNRLKFRYLRIRPWEPEKLRDVIDIIGEDVNKTPNPRPIRMTMRTEGVEELPGELRDYDG